MNPEFGKVRKPETRWNLCVAALILIAVVRVVATYNILSLTVDEPAHIACGMEWIEFGTYTLEYQHPPLARIMMAVGLYLDGVRPAHLEDKWEDGKAIVYSDHNYRARLALARMGNLPFLILAAVIVWLWARRWFGNTTGLWAVALFLCLPPVLGHAGLATLDMAATATMALALYQLVRWREQPTLRRAAVFASTVAFATLCKFSIPVFLVASAAIGLLGVRRGECPKLQFKSFCGQAAAVMSIVFFLVWAGYRFHIQPIIVPPESHTPLDRMLRPVLGQGTLLKVANRLADVPTPMGGLVRGYAELLNHDSNGHPAFLLGKVRFTGVWYFFPVVMSVKTPIGFSLLVLIGLGLVFYRFRARPWQHRVTALFPFGILIVCMASRINIGIRHILPIYPLLALLAGHAAARFFAQRKTRWVAVGLAGWVVVSSVMAHPDYLAYFNQIAGSHPERIVVDSDLDWGQDLDRLSRRLRELRVDHVGVAYTGSASLRMAGLPPYTRPKPDEITEGYVAASVGLTTIGYAERGGWAWLRDRKPIERIGKTIDLYYVTK